MSIRLRIDASIHGPWNDALNQAGYQRDSAPSHALDSAQHG